jgi:hypothetical protein
MKHLLLLFSFLLPLAAQAQLAENFANGNFTQNPVWTGDAGSFQVTSQQLQSNGPATTGTQIQLSTPCQASTGTTWEFWANLKLATSSGNLADVWLLASQADLKNPTTKGYFVRLGGTDDEVSLFRKDSAKTAAYVIDGLNGTLASTTNNLSARARNPLAYGPMEARARPRRRPHLRSRSQPAYRQHPPAQRGRGRVVALLGGQ